MNMNGDFKKNGSSYSSSWRLSLVALAKWDKEGSRSGFTLIEVVVSMAIFTLIIGGVVMFSVNAIKASTKSQAMQEAVDNARYAIDDLAKKIRTSSNVEVADSGKSLFFIDNLTVTKYCYQFVDDDSGNGKMTVKSFQLKINPDTSVITNSAQYNAVTDCNSTNYASTSIGGSGPAKDLIGSEKTSISGGFDVLKTDVSSDNPHRGFVRINVDIYYKKGLASDDPTDSAEAHIQTGVSILDYTRESGLEF